MRRHPVNKHSSAKNFRHSASKTKRINIAPAPMRTGIRL